MSGPQASPLPDGRRLHLHHGPIDLIIEAWGADRQRAYRQASRRFAFLLEELVEELPGLRQPTPVVNSFRGSIARCMADAVIPYAPDFITPMAAVAGAVADEILDAMTMGTRLNKAYVNNGGDIAIYLAAGQKLEAAIAAAGHGKITIHAKDPVRGIATSGWRGRSCSLGIADTVSVVAKSAAAADCAATVIANAVDLPGHKAISRSPACDLFPDSDLGNRLVTTGVGVLTAAETAKALDRGVRAAQKLLDKSLIGGAILVLNAETRQTGAPTPFSPKTGDLIHA